LTRIATADSPGGSKEGRRNSRRTGRWLRVRGLLPFSLPPMLIAAGLACYGAVAARPADPPETHIVLWVLTMLATALAVSALVLGWYSDRWRIAALQRELERLTTSGKTGPICLQVAGELAGLAAALNIYVAQLRSRAARLNLRKKELDIQTRITEAEKRCVQTIVELITEAVIVTDAFDEVVLANRAAQEIFGFTLGAPFRQPIHRAIRNAGMVQLIKSMRNPDEPDQRTVRVCLNSDTARPRTCRASLTRVVDPRGHVHGVVTVLRPADRAASPRPRRPHGHHSA